MTVINIAYSACVERSMHRVKAFAYACRKSGDRMETLRNMENVLITPHRAFYTENAVSEMIYNSLLSCRLTEDGEKNPWEIV